MFLVGFAFAKGLRSHTEFKIVLGKAETVQLVTEFKLIPKLEVTVGSGRLGAFFRSLVFRIGLGGFDKTFPRKRASNGGCSERKRY